MFWFIPFTNVSHNVEGKFQYCRYRFAVYEFHYIESEGEGENLSDTYIGKIKFEKKIGGILEYLGIKEIRNSYTKFNNEINGYTNLASN